MNFQRESNVRINCIFGGTPFLEKELSNMGIPGPIEKSNVHLLVKTSAESAIKICLYSRIAHSVLYEIHEFYAKHPDELYNKAKKIPWEEYIPLDGYFSIQSHVENDYIKDTRYANLKLKDAIADYMLQKYKKRPDSGSETNQTVIYLFWKKDKVKLYLDFSGETLSKHGYRKFPWKAPLQETLASAIISATGWVPGIPFINPMCGSGTLAIEAALRCIGRFPSYFRQNYGYKHIVGYLSEISTDIPMHLIPEKSLNTKIIASDRDKDAVEIAKKNAEFAGVSDLIQFKVCDFAETDIPETPGCIILNPEYGNRLGNDRELARLYPKIGDFYKQKCKGYKGFVFSGNMELSKTVGLKPYMKHLFYNARIPCTLLGYDLF